MLRRSYPNFRLRPAALLAAGAVLLAASGPRAADNVLSPGVRSALDQIRPEAIRDHVRFLADDKLEGRDTASAGGLMAAEYLAAQLQQSGLKPAGEKGTYFQQVPFVRARMDAAQSRITLAGENAKEAVLEYGNDFLLNGFTRGKTRLNAPLVFAGYGITAPEFQYDDYKDLDVRGKVVVVLTGEPTSQNPAFFDGDKDTRYAQGGSKIRLAQSRGAVGIVTLLVGPRGRQFAWEPLRAGQQRPNLVLPSGEADVFPALIVRDSGAEKLFSTGPVNWADLQKQHAEGKVQPFALPWKAGLVLGMEETPAPGPNVIARLEGSDPKLKSQAVVFSAHYDHVGRRTGTGDTIFNGAWDNASGTAGVLALARGFAALKPAPRRTVIFLFVTGEEKGLLGSQYYTRHPVVPLEQTAADINLDMTDIFGIPKEFAPLGAEYSSLIENCKEVAKSLGMGIGPDPVPELKVFTRSDQYSFIRAGVPSLFLQWASNYEDIPAEQAKAKAKEKLDTIYHKTGDEFDPTWSWEGMRRHSQVAFMIGLSVANQEAMPKWNAGSEFDKPRGLPKQGN